MQLWPSSAKHATCRHTVLAELEKLRLSVLQKVPKCRILYSRQRAPGKLGPYVVFEYKIQSYSGFVQLTKSSRAKHGGAYFSAVF